MAYIGQTIHARVKDRYKNGLLNGVSNAYFQHSIEFYGTKNFTIEIIEENVTSIEELDSLEVLYIKRFNTLYPNGYNFTDGGHSRYKISDLTKEKIGLSNQKEYDLIKIDGSNIHVINLRKFCKKNGLSYSAMLSLVQGRLKSSQGYALSGTPLTEIKDPNRTYTFANVDGRTEVVNKVIEFSKKFNYKHETALSLVFGNTFELDGWYVPGKKLDRLPDNLHEIELIGPNNCVYKISPSTKEFCRKHNLSRSSLYDLIRKRKFYYKGWRLKNLSNVELEIYNRELSKNKLYKYQARPIITNIVLKNTNNNEIIKIDQRKNISRLIPQLTRSNISDLFRKTHKSAGWELISFEKTIPEKLQSNLIKRKSKRVRPTTIVLENVVTEEIVSGNNVHDIINGGHPLCASSLYRIVRFNKQIKNWKLREIKFETEFHKIHYEN